MTQTGEYKTRQREVILEFLKQSSSRHVTIDEVWDYLKGQSVKVGRTTIYRYMEKLTAQGQLRKYHIKEGSGACYQYIGRQTNCQEHFHLKCTECGCLLHAECDYLSGVALHVMEHHRFAVDQTKTVIYGICEACKNNMDARNSHGLPGYAADRPDTPQTADCPEYLHD